MKVLALYDRLKGGTYYNGILLAFTQSVIALLFIFLDYFYSKQLNLEEFGSWKQLYFIITLTIPIFSLGIPEGYKYYIAKENKFSYFFSNALFAYFSIALFILIICIVANLLHYVDLIDIKSYYLVNFLLPLAYLSYTLNQSLRYTYVNIEKVLLHSKITLFFLAITLLFAFCVYYNFVTIKSYYLEIGTIFFILIFGLPIIRLIKKGRLHFNFKYLESVALRKILKQGIPLYLATFIGVICVNIDKGIVSLLGSKIDFAIFSVGALEVPVFAMLSAAFSQNIYPKLVKYINEDNKEKAKDLWLDTTKKVSYITYPILILLMIFSKQLIHFIYSKSYDDSVELFQIYLLVGLFRNNYYGALISASGKTKYITYYSMALLVFNSIFSVILYYFIGLKGVVWGTVIATFIMMILLLNHEGILKRFLKEFIMNKIIFFLILIIIVSYIYF